MKIFREIIKLNFPISLSIGTYDAIHLGHMEIINKMKSYNLKTAIISFYPPPFIYFGNEKSVLFTLEEKISIFEELGIDYLFILNFDEKIRNLTSDDFIKILNSNLKISNLIVGSSFKFGKDKEGDKEKLINLSKIYKFNLELIEEKKFNGEKISSSKLRNLIRNGEIEFANKFLFKNYFIFLKIEGGKISIDPLKLLPNDGKYEVKIEGEDFKKFVEIRDRKIILSDLPPFNKFKIEFLRKI